jgi:hypothetical protein
MWRLAATSAPVPAVFPSERHITINATEEVDKGLLEPGLQQVGLGQVEVNGIVVFLLSNFDLGNGKSRKSFPCHIPR